MLGSWSVGTVETEQGRALLREQFRALRSQIPDMYALMFVNSASLGLATYRTMPLHLSAGVPAVLCFAAFARMLLWLRRRTEAIPPETEVQRRLGATLVIAVVLGFAFGGWGLLLFPEANLVQRTCIGLFIFVSAISSSFCLQTFPAAARAVMIVGVAPTALRLLLSDDWFLRGLSLNLLFVAVLIHFIIRTNHRGFIEVLSSRSAMLMERERALEAERQAQELAYHDPLTGLGNRRALAEHLDGLMNAAGARRSTALLIVDLDRFKDVNDVHGHLVGDELLRQVAARLQAVMGSSSRAFRLGGDEFAVVVDCGNLGRAAPELVARSLVEALGRPFAQGRAEHHIGASIGIALFPHDAEERLTLMRKADIALYDVKLKGRGVWRFFEAAMEDAIRHRSNLETSLRLDLQDGRLTPFLQPIVDLRSREVVSFELLARWCRDGRFFVGPDQFVPIAEECGLINELMLGMLEEVCRVARAGGPRVPIAINISPVQLKDPLLGERILEVLRAHGYPPAALGIEVTENAFVSDSVSARRTVELLKEEGVQVALDDFGTGYSSLHHLQLLPFDKLKIDRSFVLAMRSDPGALKIVRAIINLASSMGLNVVAEGVEDEETASLLRSLGCGEGQGYLFGRPVPAGLASRLIAEPAAATELGRAYARGCSSA